MGRGKFKAKPSGQRHFSTPEEIQEAEYKEEESGQESGEESYDETEQKRKGTQDDINNPNLEKSKNIKAREDTRKTTELSMREREELEK